MLLSRSTSIALLALVLAMVPSFKAAAQTPARTLGDCETGEAEAFLDVGNVRAKILNNGSLFWNGGANVYEVPKGSGNTSVFASNFQMAGIVDDTLAVAATLYGPFEFWPGPISRDGSPPTDCTRYDRIYEVRRSSGRRPDPIHALTGDIADWPAHLGAPFIDAGGTPETYDPEDGDYPEMLGDQMLWWIMNDRGNIHEFTDGRPLGVEVRASAFAFDAFGSLGSMTFYRYRIRNRNDSPIRAAYIGLMTDVDLGAAFDDYVGSDTTSGTAYYYNADNDDDGNYGMAPPAIGFTVLKRPHSKIDIESRDCSYPDGKSSGLTSNVFYIGGGGPLGEPRRADDFYNYYRGRWRDGEQITVGGVGRGFSEKPTMFMYPGDPAQNAYWSERNADGQGTPIVPADRRSLSAVGPFCLGTGDETEVVFAIVWARGDSNLDSVTRMRAIAAGIQPSVDEFLEPRVLEPVPPVPVPDVPLAASLFPNPTSTASTLRLGIPRSMDVIIDIFDALGRRIHGVVDARLGAGDSTWTLDTADWRPGVYLVRMQLDHFFDTRKLVVTR